MQEGDESGGTPARTRAARWLRYAALTVTAAVVALGSYYLIHIRDREALLDRYHLRVLSAASRNCVDRLEGIHGQIGQAAEFYSDAKVDVELREGASVDALDQLRNKLELIEGLDTAERAARPGEHEDDQAWSRTWSFDHLSVLATLRTSSSDPRFEFQFRDSRLKGGADGDEAGRAGAVLELHASITLQRLLGDDLPSDIFDTVVLARADGEALLQVGSAPVLLNALPEAAPSEEGVPRQAPTKTSGAAEVDVAGRRYRLYTQPVRLPLPIHYDEGEGAPSTATWVLAGLRPARDVRAESMVVSSTLVVILAFVLALAALSLPFVRLAAIGPREELRANDVLVMAISAVLWLGVAAVGLIDGSAYAALRERRDARLDLLADDIESALEREAFVLSRQLDELTGALLGGAETRLVDILDPKGGSRETELELPPTRHPVFEMAFWFDDTGQQLAKWSTRGETTPLGKYDFRPYFKRARDRDLWRPIELEDAEGSWEPDPFFIQSIRSKTQGLLLAVLSKNIARAGSPYVVACIEAPLVSVIRPTLPSQHGFAIIDRSGLVQFHSRPERNLAENLFDELSASARLRAAVAARGKDVFDSTYRTREVRARVAPLKHFPEWSLVVFADKDGPRTFHLEVLLFTFLFFGGLLILLLAAGAWLACTHRAEPPRGGVRAAWFWPTARLVPAYRELRWAFLALAASCLLLVWVGDAARPVLCLGFTFPLVAFLALHLALQQERAPFRGVRPREWIVSALLVAVLVPQLGLVPPLAASDAAAVATSLVAVVLGCLLARWGRIELLALAGTAVIVLVGLSFGSPGLFASAGAPAALCLTHRAWYTARMRCRSEPPETCNELLGAEWQTWAPRRWHNVLATSAAALLLNLAVLPAWAFYSASFLDVAPAVAQRRALEFAQALDERAGRLNAQLAEFAMGPESEAAARRLFRLGSEPLVERFDDVHTAGSWLQASEAAQVAPAEEDWEPRPILGRLTDLVPSYGGTSQLVRAILGAGPEESRLWWSREGDRLRLSVPDYRPPLRLGGVVQKGESLDLSVKTPIEPLALRASLPLVALALLSSGAVVLLCRAVCTRAFLLDRLDDAKADGRVIGLAESANKRLFLRPSQERATQLEEAEGAFVVRLAALRQEDFAGLLGRVVGAKPTVVVVTQLEEGLEDPELRRRKLELLELVDDAGSARIDLLTNRDPMYVISSQRRDGVGSWTEADFARWSELLESFAKVRNSDSDRHRDLARPKYRRKLKATGRDPELCRRIAEECWPTWRLQEIGGMILLGRDSEALEAGHVVEVVEDLAEAHYSRIWSECSHDERLALYRLARGSWANWRAQDTLLRLRRRSLVQATPSLHVMNESFRRYVLSAESPSTIEQWARHGDASLWSRLRGPLILGLIVVVLFFFFTQREAFNQTLGALAALAAGGPAVVRLAGIVGEGRRSTQTRA